jgi:hypothetical protein
MAIGNIGTGKKSVVSLKEEYSYGVVGTSTAVWLRRLSHNFDRNPVFVDTGHAASTELGYTKETVHDVGGSYDCELDATTLGWLLKWIMNASVSSVQQGATSEYKHTIKFGDAPRTIKVYENKGGLSTPYYENYLGMFLTSLSVNLDMAGTLRGGLDFIGQTSEAGSNPGSPSIAAENLTFAFGDIAYYVGTAGATTIAAMTPWTDPFDFELNMLRIGADNKNYNSDGTGKPVGTYEGQPGVTLRLAAELTTSHKLATFLAGTEVSFGMVWDTDVAIPTGNGSNYKLNLIFPRVRFEKYQVRATSPGKIVAVVPIKIMKDQTTTYSISAELYNNTVSYPDSTA